MPCAWIPVCAGARKSDRTELGPVSFMHEELDDSASSIMRLQFDDDCGWS